MRRQPRKNEQGIAIIIVIAIMVALVMLVAALLSVVTQHSDAARAFKQEQITMLGALSARALVVERIAEIGKNVYPPKSVAYEGQNKFLTSPWLAEGENQENPLDLFNATEKEIGDSFAVLGNFDKQLNNGDGGGDFYSLRYDYRVLLLDKTDNTATNANGSKDLTTIDFSGCLYPEILRNSSANVLPDKIKEVFKNLVKAKDIESELSEIKLVAPKDGKLTIEELANVVATPNATFRENATTTIGTVSRFYSFGQIGARLKYDREIKKCTCPAPANKKHDTKSACPAWDGNPEVMALGLNFDIFSPLRNASKDAVKKFVYNEKTPNWLLAAMVWQYNNNKESSVNLDLTQIYEKLKTAKTTITSAADLQVVHDNLLALAGGDANQEAALRKLAKSLFGNPVGTPTAAADENFTGCLVFDSSDANQSKIRTRYFRIFLYVVLFNEATGETVSNAKLDMVYDSGTKTAIYNRYFDDVE